MSSDSATGKPITITFKDESGKLIKGISESITRHAIINLKVEGRDADGNLTATREGPANMTLAQFAELVQTGLLNTAETVTDVTNTGRSITAGQAITTANTPMIVAGITNSPAAAFTDYALNSIATGGTYAGSNSSGNQLATVNSLSGSAFTITATITNTSGSPINYAEVGIAVSATVSAVTRSFLICHDTFTAVTVSNNGTLAVTYTLTFS